MSLNGNRPHLPPPAKSLSAQVLLLTIFFVMLGEVLIYAPSAGRFRYEYLRDRLATAHVAVLALLATPDNMVSEALQAELLQHGDHAWHGFEITPVAFEHEGILAFAQVPWKRLAKLHFHFGNHGFKGGANKAMVHFTFSEINAVFGQESQVNIHRYLFAIKQHAIAIKDDVGNHLAPRCLKVLMTCS